MTYSNSYIKIFTHRCIGDAQLNQAFYFCDVSRDFVDYTFMLCLNAIFIAKGQHQKVFVTACLYWYGGREVTILTPSEKNRITLQDASCI